MRDHSTADGQAVRGNEIPSAIKSVSRKRGHVSQTSKAIQDLERYIVEAQVQQMTKFYFRPAVEESTSRRPSEMRQECSPQVMLWSLAFTQTVREMRFLFSAPMAQQLITQVCHRDQRIFRLRQPLRRLRGRLWSYSPPTISRPRDHARRNLRSTSSSSSGRSPVFTIGLARLRSKSAIAGAALNRCVRSWPRSQVTRLRKG